MDANRRLPPSDRSAHPSHRNQRNTPFGESEVGFAEDVFHFFITWDKASEPQALANATHAVQTMCLC